MGADDDRSQTNNVVVIPVFGRDGVSKRIIVYDSDAAHGHLQPRFTNPVRPPSGVNSVSGVGSGQVESFESKFTGELLFVEANGVFWLISIAG